MSSRKAEKPEAGCFRSPAVFFRHDLCKICRLMLVFFIQVWKRLPGVFTIKQDSSPVARCTDLCGFTLQCSRPRSFTLQCYIGVVFTLQCFVFVWFHVSVLSLCFILQSFMSLCCFTLYSAHVFVWLHVTVCTCFCGYTLQCARVSVVTRYSLHVFLWLHVAE